ncbi:MAG: hypothetical protein L6302_04145 [Desulfobacteraceae bacterium]|nr:hypothetical protein [Desulfobacteraceae bacterium]
MKKNIFFNRASFIGKNYYHQESDQKAGSSCQWILYRRRESIWEKAWFLNEDPSAVPIYEENDDLVFISSGDWHHPW